MAKWSFWWQYCPNCSHRVEWDAEDEPTETLVICTNCPYQEIVDTTSENRPE